MFDDRDDTRTGEKFTNADLLGIPYHVIVSEKATEIIRRKLKKRNRAREIGSFANRRYNKKKTPTQKSGQAVKNMFSKFKKMFSSSIGIDLGTANISCLCPWRRNRDKRTFGSGDKSEKPVQLVAMEVLSSVSILAERPVNQRRQNSQWRRHLRFWSGARNAVLFYPRVIKNKHSILSRPTIVISVPSSITNVEVRAVRVAA